MKLLIIFIWILNAWLSCNGHKEMKTMPNANNKVQDTIIDPIDTQNQCSCNPFLGKMNTMPAQEILSLNKQIIPCLIDSIDVNKTSFVGFKDPRSSYIGSYIFNQYGIMYAYWIDYILSKDSVETVKKTWSDDDSLSHYNEWTKPYRIYSEGVIVKLDENNKPILEPLTHEDMIKIKKMYLDWWEKNKNKPIKTLRAEFRSGNKILKYPYAWI